MTGQYTPEKKMFFVSQATKNKLVTISAMSQEVPQNVMVKGLQGCGKSELAEQFAAAMGRPFMAFEVGLFNEAGQWTGTNTLREGNVVFQKSGFLEAISTQNCVILLDELNRAETPKALNALFSVLDDNRKVWVDELKRWVHVSRGVVFFATVNEGTEFVGTDFLDKALNDRFYYIEMQIIPPEQEAILLVNRTGISLQQAKELVAMFTKVRSAGYAISTRKAINVAKLITGGLGTKDAIEFALGMDKDTLERILLAVHLFSDIENSPTKDAWVELN
ncbi:MAG: AAA family ATPase [Chloroflexi bacterium]|nr:AAA family ATPase [Chloroflexota bacterium]